MKIFTNYDEIERLCEAMIRDFSAGRSCEGLFRVEIGEFVTGYLGVPVVYETFAEPDPGRIGFLSDGKRPLKVLRRSGEKEVVYPEGTAVIEKKLLAPGETARRRFTIAHEGAHHMIERHARLREELFSGEDPEGGEDPLCGAVRAGEHLANRAAACFLMPRYLVLRALARFNGGRKVLCFEGGVLAKEQKLVIREMADAMGVSYTAFFNRLKELGLFEEHPIGEYIRGELRYGGDGRWTG